jgi:tRNA/rRNA methyltransferase
MNPSQLMANVVVVLVRPHYAGNLGAVARAMRNMGASELVLVDPFADPADREARKRSTHGEEILNRARTVPNLATALYGCLSAIGTSARGGQLIRSHAADPAMCARAAAPLLQQGKVCLVFGPEPSGLSNGEITLCQHLICIPADEGYPALNLAHSVAICLYEMRLACLRDHELAVQEPPAPLELQERMFQALEAALTDIHYLYGPRAPALMHGIRRLISRASPTEMEVKLLLGLARQIRWFGSRPFEEKPVQPDPHAGPDFLDNAKGIERG